jgi:4'-phosphopantetheinyl transferase
LNRRLEFANEWTDAPPDVRLLPGELHVWCAPLPSVPATEQALQSTLSADEIIRAQRFAFEGDRIRFLRSHLLLRRLLGRYLGIAADQVELGNSGLGKPLVLTTPGVKFNMSHSEAVAIYAFAACDEVGVDVERVRSDIDVSRIAERYFDASELRPMSRSNQPIDLVDFFTCWVRKEAVLKASGDGLTVPLSAVKVAGSEIHPEHIIARVATGGRAWRVFDLPEIPGYRAAAAVEGDASRILCWTISPESTGQA